MIRTLLCSTALIIAAPAIAQEMTPQTDPMQATPAAPAAPAAPAEQAAPAAPAQDATTPTPQAAQPAPASTVASIVESEFPAYDTDKSGQLEKTEFAKWMMALKDQEAKATGKTLQPAEVTAWADGAFMTADADKSTSVTKAELVTYLSGGAA
ncbi:EF-hand domain-containing protein [Sphingobium algorifonticola]|uniref:EF-hand domain-containing protein n=1 Tax=Sphingobium algorifonticola TaxID=2008318 RepID=A0A437J700_9SPHN|nr:EF-hand domain-containing protein [Sphingobium algorifonticola]RVT40958.1 EF-hand domain-containing protein [Sphingobium algorifonticola]